MAYSLPNTILNGTTGDAGQVEANFLALLSAVNNSLAADGTIGPTAGINWNGQSLSGVGALAAGTLTTTGAISAGAAVSAATLAVTGGATVGGNAVVSGTMSSGGSTITSGTTAQFGDGNFFAQIGGGNPLISFGANSYVGFVRSSGTYNFVIGNTVAASMLATGLTVPGLTVSGATILAGGVSGSTTFNGSVAFPAGVTGNVTFAGAVGAASFSTSGSIGGATLTVSGGATVGGNAVVTGQGQFTGGVTFGDGNFLAQIGGGNPLILFDANDYLSYNRSTNKLTVVIGGVALFSIDSSGNVIAKGNVTANGAP